MGMRTYRGVLNGVAGAILLSGAIAALCAASASASVYSTLVLGDSPSATGGWARRPARRWSTRRRRTNNGTYLNGVTLGQPGMTAGDTAATFDGVNDSARVPQTTSLNVGSSFSAEAWIKRTSTTELAGALQQGRQRVPAARDGARSGNQVWLRRADVATIAHSTVPIPADGQLPPHRRDDERGGHADDLRRRRAAPSSGSALQTIQNTTFPITVGSSASAASNYDEFALYPRVLAAPEVLEHFQAGTDIPPTAVDDSATVTEDSGVGPIDVLANDTDPDVGPKAIASASDPAHGTVVPTGGTPGAYTGLTYQPDANYCNTGGPTAPDTFTYTLTTAARARRSR